MRISYWSSDVCSSDLTPHLELEVLNPLFEEIQLEFDVQYRSEDIAFFTQQLRSDLEQFLAPWAFDNSSDIRFGSSVNKSVLINFIEERPYVDYISGVKMYRISEGHRSNDREEAFARSEERREGKEGVSTVKSTWATDH